MNSLSLLVRRATMVASRRAPVLSVQVARAFSTAIPTKNAFAVEAPDGTSDDLIDVEMHQVEDIIDHASKFEDVEAVRKLHAQQDAAKKIFAVEAPDGSPDDLFKAELHEVEEIVEESVKLHEKK